MPDSIYLHYEGQHGVAFTTKHSLSTSDTQDSIIEAFLSKYSGKLDSLSLELRHEDGRALCFKGNDAPKDRDDIFLVDCPKRKPSTVTTAKPPSAPSSSATTSSSSSSSTALSSEAAKKIIKLISSKRYAEARKQCEIAMKQSPKDAIFPAIMTQIMLQCEKYDAAVDYGETAEPGIKLNPSPLMSSKKLTYLLAKAHFHSAQYNDAWQKLRELSTSSSSPTRSAGSEQQNLDLDIIALQAECLFAADRHGDAANLINAHMTDPGAEEHLGILLAYSSFALPYGKIPEALRAMLKAVTIDQKNKRARKTLTEILVKDDGFAELLEQLAPSPKSAAAYAFIGTIAKEHSAIPQCIGLFSLALKFRPQSASYALNLMHAIEIQGEYESALASIKEFLKMNPSMRAGKKGVSCKELLDACDERVVEVSEQGRAVLWVDDGNGGYCTIHKISPSPAGTSMLTPDDASTPWHSSNAEKEAYDDDALDLIAIGFTMIKLLYLQGNLQALPALYRTMEPTRMMSKTSIHTTSIRNEHAYYQSIAQILSFRAKSCQGLSIDGQVNSDDGAAPYLRDVTTICCNPFTHPSFTQAAKNPIYAVGDSHCLSCAWAVVVVNGAPRLIVPKLVTGVKHWHLRQESDFYPKFNFKTALSSIPDKASVMFIIGEIDCREGILLAVERDKYSSVQEGMKSTVAIFMKVVTGLIKTKKLDVFLHPVLPMLPETRSLVVAYNALYKDAAQKLALTTPSLKWLNFFEALFTPDTLDVRPDLPMDGTHISPVYCQLVEQAINAAKE